MAFVFAKIKGFFSGDVRTVGVKKNALFSICLRCVSIAVSFLLVPLTIGYVSSELYGVWLALSSIIVWLSFLDIGFSQGLKNKLTEALALKDYARGKKLVSTTYFLMLLVFIPIGIILQLMIPLIDWCSLLNVDVQYENDILKTMHVLLAFACLQQVVNVLVSVTAAFQKVALSNSFGVIGNFLSLVLIIAFTQFVPSSLLVLCFAITAMPILVTIVFSFALYFGRFNEVRPSPRYIDLSLTKDLFGLGYKFFIINIQVVILYQSTNVLISNLSSPLDVATYNIAYKYLNVAMMVYTIITAPLWPAYTDAFVKGDFEWMRRMKQKMTKVLLASVVSCAVMSAFSPVVYRLWIGDEIDIPFCMTILVAMYVSVYCWMSLNCTILVGMSKIRLEMFLVVFGMILHIPMSILLGGYIGAYGVVVSMIIINLIYAIAFAIQVDKLLNQKAYGIWSK